MRRIPTNYRNGELKRAILEGGGGGCLFICVFIFTPKEVFFIQNVCLEEITIFGMNVFGREWC